MRYEHTAKKPYGILAGLVAICLAQAALGETQEWRGNLYYEGTLDFSTESYWTGTGIPGMDDVALFTGDGDQAIEAGSDFTVRFTENITNQSIQFLDGTYTVTLDLNGYTHTTSLLSPRGRIDGSGENGVIVNLAGGTADWEVMDIGYDGRGTVNVSGSGAALNIVQNGTVNTPMSIGRSSGATGLLSVSDGATLNSVRNLVMGNANGSTGTFHVSDATATTSHHFWIGDYGHGALVIENGGVVDVRGGNLYVVFAQRSGGTATGLITGEGSLLRSNATTDTRGIGIGGDPHEANAGEWAHVTVADQARMEAARRIRILGGSSLTVDNGTVEAGTDFFANDATAGNESRLAFVIYNADRDALIQAGGDVGIGANVELEVSLGTGHSFAYGDFVELVQYGGSLAGMFKDYDEGAALDLGLGGDLVFELTYAGGIDDKRIGLKVIPEPGTLALLLGGTVLLVLRQRRRVR